MARVLIPLPTVRGIFCEIHLPTENSDRSAQTFERLRGHTGLTRLAELNLAESHDKIRRLEAVSRFTKHSELIKYGVLEKFISIQAWLLSLHGHLPANDTLQNNLDVGKFVAVLAFSATILKLFKKKFALISVSKRSRKDVVLFSKFKAKFELLHDRGIAQSKKRGNDNQILRFGRTNLLTPLPEERLA